MTFRYFDSTDVGAPTLPGNLAGSLITLLDAILVSGYGSRTALGWTKLYSSGGTGAIYQKASGTTMLLRVDDSGSHATLTTRVAIVRGYESATGYSTGLTDAFPLVAQVSDTNCLWLKSDTNSATARPWQAWGDESVMYLCVQTNGTTQGDVYVFGDMESVRGADAFNCFINTRNSVSVGANLAFTAPMTSTYTTAQAGNIATYMARTADGVVKSPRVAMLRRGVGALGVLSTSAVSYIAPDEDSNYNFEPLEIVDSYSQNGTPGAKAATRAIMRGVFEPMHGVTWSSITLRTDTIRNTPRYPGAEFRLLMPGVQALSTGAADRFFAQTAGDWVPERG
jgi:hypothetical protein